MEQVEIFKNIITERKHLVKVGCAFLESHNNLADKEKLKQITYLCSGSFIPNLYDSCSIYQHDPEQFIYVIKIFEMIFQYCLTSELCITLLTFGNFNQLFKMTQETISKATPEVIIRLTIVYIQLLCNIGVFIISSNPSPGWLQKTEYVTYTLWLCNNTSQSLMLKLCSERNIALAYIRTLQSCYWVLCKDHNTEHWYMFLQGYTLLLRVFIQIFEAPLLPKHRALLESNPSPISMFILLTLGFESELSCPPVHVLLYWSDNYFTSLLGMAITIFGSLYKWVDSFAQTSKKHQQLIIDFTEQSTHAYLRWQVVRMWIGRTSSHYAFARFIGMINSYWTKWLSRCCKKMQVVSALVVKYIGERSLTKTLETEKKLISSQFAHQIQINSLVNCCSYSKCIRKVPEPEMKQDFSQSTRMRTAELPELFDSDARLVGPEPAEYTLTICSSCRLVRYCSKQCQKSDWKEHKTWCKEIALVRESAIKVMHESEK